MITICIAVYNRADTMLPCLESLQQLEGEFALSVFDAGSNDIDYTPYLERFRNTAYHYHKDMTGSSFRDGHYNRSMARIKSLNIKNHQPEDKIFFLDCDMVVPPNFLRLINEHVAPGKSFFPVCYGLHKDAPRIVRGDMPPRRNRNRKRANGWWRTRGFGNCGFTYPDYLRIGGWDSKFVLWGKEDGDIFHRAKQLTQVVRYRVPNFFHLWHTPDRHSCIWGKQ